MAAVVLLLESTTCASWVAQRHTVPVEERSPGMLERLKILRVVAVEGYFSKINVQARRFRLNPTNA